jgi:D-alanine-D-alanine ligase
LSKQRGNYALQEKFSGKENVKDHTDFEVAHHKKALLKADFEVEVIEWGDSFIHDLKSSKADLVFNVSSLVEAAILEEAGIPFVGSGTEGIVLARNKARAKQIWKKRGIPTSDFAVLEDMDACEQFLQAPSVPFPLFIKPVKGRGSAGITRKSLIETPTQLKEHAEKLFKTIEQPVLIERFLEGREITVGIIGNGGNTRSLPPLEIRYTGADQFLTYNKKEQDADRFICPAPLSDAEANALDDYAKRAFRALGLRDFTRIDTKLTEEGFMLLEANSFAGLACDPPENPISYIGHMARAEGKDGAELFKELIAVCLERIGEK